MTKEEIRIEMIRHLAEQLETFWAEHADVSTNDPWGGDVVFTIGSEEIARANDRILRSAEERLVVPLLGEHSLVPAFLDRFVEPWMKEAQAYVEGEANAVAAEL